MGWNSDVPDRQWEGKAEGARLRKHSRRGECAGTGYQRRHEAHEGTSDYRPVVSHDFVSFVTFPSTDYWPWLDVLVAPPGSRNEMYSPEYAPPPTATMMYCLPSAE